MILLKKYLNNKEIDLLSLDAEEYEYEILKGLNLYKAKYILIEIYTKDYEKIFKHIISHNYILH